MAVTESAFGTYPGGKEVSLYTLSNGKGMGAAVTNVGAALVRVMVPDRNGIMADVVLGCGRAEDYMDNGCFLGVVVGPNANRTGGACFCLDGVTYHLDANAGSNNLHSHKTMGWHKRFWEAVTGENSVTFKLEDKDGSLGFPGERKVSVTYSLEEDNSLRIHYHGCSDRRTILNLTNHTYFNLEGHDSGSVEDHELWLGASQFTPTDSESIPTGEIVSVAGTPMDFTAAKSIGKEMGAEYAQLKMAGGYDHNWVIDGWDGTLRHFATVKAPGSGRVLDAYTTLPGVQFYAGNFLEEKAGKGGISYGPRMGFCLETQYFPDSANKPQFPSAVFGGDREYDAVTVYRFTAV